MSNLLRFTSGIFSNVKRYTGKFMPVANNFHSLTADSTSTAKPGGLFSVFTRNVIRDHFPRPSEKKRIRRHGYKTRMSTPEGRRIIMQRILKGKHVLTH